MKMSDVFDGDVVDINLFQDSCYIDTDEADYEIEDSEVKDRVIHAINNHDRLTEENKQLREALFNLSEWKPLEAYENALCEAKDLLDRLNK